MCTSQACTAAAKPKDSYTEHYMIPFLQARDLIEQHCRPIECETVQIDQALGRVLVEPVSARENVPPFDNTAMDGYAVVASDLKKASSSNPVRLKQAGISAAGDALESNAGPTEGTAWKIMTGAPVPAGYDAIIAVEDTKSRGTDVECFFAPEKGAHIRTAGQDFLLGEPYLSKGQIINANRIMALATLGQSNICVRKKPKVVVFATGKELVDDLSQPLLPGQIRNSNLPYIISWLSSLPVDVVNAGTNHDDEQAFTQSLKSQIEQGADIIISSGAVSMGDFDFIPKIIQQLGGEIVFHKTKIRPGKPILFARFPNGTLYFGLPGNPISAAIGLRFFVAHALEKILGIESELPTLLPLQNDYPKKEGFRMICKSAIVSSPDRAQQISVLPGQESFKIQPMIHSDGWLVIEEDVATAKAGKLYSFYPNLPQWVLA